MKRSVLLTGVTSVGLLVPLLLFAAAVSTGATLEKDVSTTDHGAGGFAQAAVVRIQPPSVTTGAGSIVTITVDIEGANDLGGFEFTLLHDRTVLTVTGAALGPFLSSTGRQTIPLGPIYTDTSPITTGVILGGVSFTLGGLGGASGSGVLSVLTLTTNLPGSTLLQLANVKLANTLATPQPVNHEGGQVIVVGTGTPTPVGTIPAPTATPAAQLFLPLIAK